MLILKKKIINILTKKGKKATVEKVFLKAVKTLQQEYKKSTEKLIRLAVYHSLSPFKILTFRQKTKKKKKKSERSTILYKKLWKSNIFCNKKFIKNYKYKKKNQFKKCHNNLKNEILLASKISSHSVEIKKNIQKFITDKRYLLRYYKW